MPDLRDPRLMYLKAGLFVVIGVVSVTILLLDRPTLKAAALISIVVWSFCRAYYFAFYVIERYIDPGFRFSGLWSVAHHLGSKKKRDD